MRVILNCVKVAFSFPAAPYAVAVEIWHFLCAIFFGQKYCASDETTV